MRIMHSPFAESQREPWLVVDFADLADLPGGPPSGWTEEDFGKLSPGLRREAYALALSRLSREDLLDVVAGWSRDEFDRLLGYLPIEIRAAAKMKWERNHIMIYEPEGGIDADRFARADAVADAAAARIEGRERL